MRTEDGYFIQRCLNGETESFAFLVDKYRESVFSFAYTKLRNFDDAEDVTQEVFLKAYEKLHTLRRWDNFAIWLHTITNNLCINLLKSYTMRSQYAKAKQNDLSVENSGSRNEDSRLELLNKALDNLPEIYRQVITLYYLGDMDSEEISKFLGLSASTIRQRLSRARSELKEEILMIMGSTFEQYKLRVGFTFHIMEMTKQIRINPISITKGLSLGLSVAVGMVALFFGIGQHIVPINLSEFLPISASSGETKIQEIGEYPVDVLNLSNVSILSNANVNGSGFGSEAPSLQNALFMSPQAGDTWTKKADMPTARQGLGCSAVNGKIYAIGGEGIWNAQSVTVEEYDPLADKWIKKSDMPTARWNLSTSVVNGKIYAIGGGFTDGNEGFLILPTVEEYDPVADKWTKKADMPAPRYELSTCTVNGKIYAVGGSNWNDPSLSTLEEYDPLANKWTKKSDMPTPRVCLGTSVVDGKIYAIGGWNKNEELPTVEEYDPSSDKWTKKADMPTGRGGLTTATINRKIYAIGGGDKNDLPTVEEYDPSSDKWTKKADMPTARWNPGASEVNGRIYVIGGHAPDPILYYSTVEEYDTGFAGEGVNLKGKLPTTWGDVRTASKR